jgi:hypothetical protein
MLLLNYSLSQTETKGGSTAAGPVGPSKEIYYRFFLYAIDFCVLYINRRATVKGALAGLPAPTF